MARLHSYVVRYDSGFAPNPFYDYCTLATCKPGIRRGAQVGDWVVGSGSNSFKVRRGGRLVYAARITEILTFDDYSTDSRFEKKKPVLRGSRKQACGDNVYYRQTLSSSWSQKDSFHSLPNGDFNQKHIKRDTGVNKVLVSDNFVYFGGEGPLFPKDLTDSRGRWICKEGIGITCFEEPALINNFENWFNGLGVRGYQGAPLEWLTLRGT